MYLELNNWIKLRTTKIKTGKLAHFTEASSNRNFYFNQKGKFKANFDGTLVLSASVALLEEGPFSYENSIQS